MVSYCRHMESEFSSSTLSNSTVKSQLSPIFVNIDHKTIAFHKLKIFLKNVDFYVLKIICTRAAHMMTWKYYIVVKIHNTVHSFYFFYLQNFTSDKFKFLLAKCTIMFAVRTTHRNPEKKKVTVIQ